MSASSAASGTPSEERRRRRAMNRFFEVAIVEAGGRRVVVVLKMFRTRPDQPQREHQRYGHEEEEASLGLLHLALLVSDAFDFAS